MPDKEVAKERVQIAPFYIDPALAANMDALINQLGIDGRVAFCRMALRQAVRNLTPVVPAQPVAEQENFFAEQTTTPIG